MQRDAFCALASTTDPPLEELALALAAEFEPVDEQAVRAQLDVLADDARPAVAAAGGDPAAELEALSSVLVNPEATFDDRHEAVDRLCRERSPRVVDTLLAALEVRPAPSALRRLSEWGVPEALPHVERALAVVAPDNPADLWTLTALQRRLQAWARTFQAM